MSIGGVEDQWVRYWDEGATIAKLEYEVEAPTLQSAPAKEKEKRKKKGSLSPNNVWTTSDFGHQSWMLHLRPQRRLLPFLFLTSLSP